MKNYIGITGFKTVQEITYALLQFKKYGIEEMNRLPMIGLLISPRNLDPDWESDRYPRLSSFKSLLDASFKNKQKSFITLHIDSKSKISWEDDFKCLLENIDMMECVNGFQINVMHPELEKIKELKEKYGKKIILQYSRDFLQKPVNVAVKELEKYAPFIDYVLIDPSRGKGEIMNVELTCKHFIKIKEKLNLNVAFAGGLTPENIKQIIPTIISNINSTDFSIDIETGVRNVFNQLDLILVERYIHNSIKLMRMMK